MKKIILSSLMAMAVGGACAQAYVGGNVGLTHLNANCASGVKCDKNDTGFKLYGGMRFSPVVSAELGYADFGKAKLGTLDYTGKGAIAALVLRAEFMPRMAAVGRVGAANITTKRSGAGATTSSQTALKVYYGLGAEYEVMKNLKAVADLDIVEVDFAGNSGTARMLSLGAQYSF